MYNTLDMLINNGVDLEDKNNIRYVRLLEDIAEREYCNFPIEEEDFIQDLVYEIDHILLIVLDSYKKVDKVTKKINGNKVIKNYLINLNETGMHSRTL